MNIIGYEEFIRNRITELRHQNHMSAYKLSHSISKNYAYIYNVTSRKGHLSLQGFLSLCNSLSVTPAEFFAPAEHSSPFDETKKSLSQLSRADLELMLRIVKKLCENTY